LHQLDAFAERLPAAHAATVVCAELDVAERTVRYACAGHLPPLLVEPDGTTTYLWEGRSLPLAMGALGGTRGEGAVALAPGAALVLYTDGLVERRDRGLDEGMDLLATLMAEHGPDAADGVLDRLIATMLDGEAVHDDVCVLHLYVEPSAYAAVVASFDELRGLRRGLEAWMTELGVDGTTTGEVVLAAVELATNGIEASPTGVASVRAQAVGGTLRIVVHNEGEPFRGPVGIPVTPDRGRGRGLAVAAALTDSVAFADVEGATKVTITRRYAEPDGG
jgi:serine/threonine-protein kinase RsbW